MILENSSKHFVSTCTHVNFVNIVLFAVKKRRTILLDAVATFPCLHMIQTAICLLHRSVAVRDGSSTLVLVL